MSFVVGRTGTFGIKAMFGCHKVKFVKVNAGWTYFARQMCWGLKAKNFLVHQKVEGKKERASCTKSLFLKDRQSFV